MKKSPQWTLVPSKEEEKEDEEKEEEEKEEE